MHELPQSYWFARSGPAEELDAVVVGGGLVGVSTAWWAARQGLRVTLLEGERLAAGATGRSNGFLLTGGLRPPTRLAERLGSEVAIDLWRLSLENRQRLEHEVFAPGRIACDFYAERSWRGALAGSAQEGEWRESAALLSGAGLPGRWAEVAEVRRAGGGDALGGALVVDGDGGVDPVALCHGLAREAGVEVRPAVKVRRLEPEGDGVLLVWNGGRAVARRVVLAVNAFTAPLVPSLAAELTPLGVQGLATAPGRRWLHGLWAVDGPGLWVRQLADGTIVAAGGREAPSPAESGYLELPTASGQASLEQALWQAFPQGRGPRVEYRWAGTIARTADGLPRVGAVPGIPGAAYACGFNGQGLSLGFAVGHRLARWLLDPAAPPSLAG